MHIYIYIYIDEETEETTFIDIGLRPPPRCRSPFAVYRLGDLGSRPDSIDEARNSQRLRGLPL